MLAVLMFSMPLIGLSNVTRAVEHGRDRFFLPALSTGIGSVGNTLTLLVLYPRAGAIAMAWAYLVASALQASVTVIPVLSHGWRRLMPLRGDGVREIARLMMPFVLFGTLIHSTPLFERYFASGLPDGQLSYLEYASKISGIVIALLGSGVATAVFPAMTRAHLRAGDKGLIERAEYGLRLTLAVCLPTLSIISAVAVPLVTILFEHGAFSHVDTLSVSRVLPIALSSGVVVGMAVSLVGRVYYVSKDTHTVSLVTAATSALYVLLARVLVGAQGYSGLAWARLLSAGLSLVMLSGLLVRRLNLDLSALSKRILGYGLASLVAYAAARLTYLGLGSLPAFPRLLSAMAAGVFLYMATLLPIDRQVAGAVLEMTGSRQVLTGARAMLGLK
jgi:putative peptidoglycan lipid II flippase